MSLQECCILLIALWPPEIVVRGKGVAVDRISLTYTWLGSIKSVSLQVAPAHPWTRQNRLELDIDSARTELCEFR